MADITIKLDAPYVTAEEYSRRSGITLKTVRDYVKNGMLPVKRRKNAGSRQLIMINMAALTINAIEEAEDAKRISKQFKEEL